ncbi:hypothetical protein TYRP_022160 [Tyrophagus putrescentiae]|nr:hypothetical protein TYRP_022160 [Tyrophagus putrescentiae]
MWAYSSPAEGFFGSASVSLYLWWDRWSRAYPKALPCIVIVWRMTSRIRSGRRALKLRCAHRRCPPTANQNRFFTRNSHARKGSNDVSKSYCEHADRLPAFPNVQQPKGKEQVQSSKNVGYLCLSLKPFTRTLLSDIVTTIKITA